VTELGENEPEYHALVATIHFAFSQRTLYGGPACGLTDADVAKYCSGWEISNASRHAPEEEESYEMSVGEAPPELFEKAGVPERIEFILTQLRDLRHEISDRTAQKSRLLSTTLVRREGFHSHPTTE
jgi:hypothetical protein